jgi:hypothetical protein
VIHVAFATEVVHHENLARRCCCQGRGMGAKAALDWMRERGRSPLRNHHFGEKKTGQPRSSIGWPPPPYAD